MKYEVPCIYVVTSIYVRRSFHPSLYVSATCSYFHPLPSFSNKLPVLHLSFRCKETFIYIRKNVRLLSSNDLLLTVYGSRFAPTPPKRLLRRASYICAPCGWEQGTNGITSGWDQESQAGACFVSNDYGRKWEFP